MLLTLFPFLSASAITGPVLGVGTACRVYPHGEAPPNVERPYVLWQVITGQPFNTLADVPAGDRFMCQFDIYGDTEAQARSAFEPLRWELEKAGQIEDYNGTSRDPDTGLYRIGLDWSYVGARTWTPPPSGNVDD